MAYVDEIIVPQAGTKREFFMKTMPFEVKSAEKALKEFGEAMIEDPMRAFEWADKQFVIAANLVVLRQMIFCMQHCTTIDDILQTFMDKIMYYAHYADNRGGNVSNQHMKDAMIAATTRMYYRLKEIKNLD